MPSADTSGFQLPWWALWVAFAATLAGLLIYFYGSSTREGRKSFFALTVLAWLFIPIFPLVFILQSFPDSTTEGDFLKFKVGGAFASYVLLWFGGIKLTTRGVETDAERKRIAKLEEISEYVAVLKPILEEGKTPRPLLDTDTFRYRVTGTSRYISVITGDLASVRCAEIWVNSENTNMQMARFGERSFSSAIRYMGALKDPITGMVKDDTISKALATKLGEVGQVAPAFVVETAAGELAGSNGVKHILHVAAVTGEPASGYRPIGRIQDCITNCLRRADTLPTAPKSILFPLMGTGTGQGNLEETVERLFKAAITYLLQHDVASDTRKATTLEEVYFVAFNERDLAITQKVLANTDKVSRV